MTSERRIAWVDASWGASGDMLLAALFDAGVDPMVMDAAARAVAPVELRFWHEVRHGFRVARAEVRPTEDETAHHRAWRDIRALIDGADLDSAVADLARQVFARLAEAEGAVHGSAPDDVHFHEVGGHDSIGDIVGVCAGFVALRADLRVGPLALGGGTAQTRHGAISVPGPAVLALLARADAPAHGGPVDVELCTPTGAALLTVLADGYGPMPSMTVTSTGTSAGSRVLPDTAGALRLVVGEPAGDRTNLGGDHSEALVLETNVDDLDPRVWPHVLSALLEAGASDAWLTPILMKKGRPAHTLHVLIADDPVLRHRICHVVLTETSAIGLRATPVAKLALDRTETTVEVEGQAVRVKLAHLDGAVVNAQPEHEDVRAAAAALGLPLKVALAHASARASALLGTMSPDPGIAPSRPADSSEPTP